jgi:hypothetical protein
LIKKHILINTCKHHSPRPALTALGSSLNGKVGKSGLDSRATPARPRVVARKKGIENLGKGG